MNARRLELACADPASRTKPQLAVEPVDAALGAGVPFRAVVADCFYGENATFEGALRAAALPCVPALKPAGGVWAPAEAAHTPEAAARELTRDGPGAPGDWTPVVRRFRDGHEETRWAAELTFGPYGPDRPRRAVVATTDPATLPELSTWYPVTDLPRPGAPHAAEAPLAPADPAEVVRLYGLRNRVEQGYKQVKRELGWADFMVRSDRAIRRHWHLVCCAFSFRWRAWFAELGSPTAPAEPHAAPAAAAAAGRGGMACLSPARPVAWPMTLRRVRGWLDPGTFLWRCWRAWSNAPPPPELQALLHSVGQGRPLNLSLPP